MEDIEIGIEAEGRKEIAAKMGVFLADTFTLYLKTYSYHWNVTGPHFVEYHALLEEQYTELAKSADKIAERIRALGYRAPGSLKDYGRLSQIPEDEMSEELPSAEGMLSNLREDRERLAKDIRAFIPQCQLHNDEATMDLLVNQLEKHEKAAWFLRNITTASSGVVSSLKKWASA